MENPAALLAIAVTVLLTVGMVLLYSASGARAGLENIRIESNAGTLVESAYRAHHGMDYLIRQGVWTILGIGLGIFLIRTPMEILEKYAPYVLLFSLFTLVLVVASPLGVESKGARRWLYIGPFTVQPSEFAKIALVLYMAKFLADKRDRIKDFWKGFVPAVGIMAIFGILIVLERDLGTIVLMGGVVTGMWALARVKISHLAVLGAAAIPVLLFLIFQHSYRQNRILAFTDPEKYAMTHAYQLNQSLIAVGSGGVFGTGLGMGLQKYHFLSESHTDFIFAIVCEELGLIGALSICLLFTAFVISGFYISYKAKDYFSGLLAAGLTMVIGCAAFMNFFVVLGMAPTKGLALPFFSYGGSSMIASLVCAALLINVSNHTMAIDGSREVC